MATNTTMARKATPQMIAGRLRREAEEKRQKEQERRELAEQDNNESDNDMSENSEDDHEPVERTRGK